MSLITRCPACSTLFKVVPDQLRVSEGWVRCGQCDEVFDANAQLQSDARSALDFTPPPAAVPSAETGLDTEPQMPVDAGPELEQALASQLEWPEPPESTFDALMDARPGAASDAGPSLHLELPQDTPDAVEISESAAPAEPVWDQRDALHADADVDMDAKATPGGLAEHAAERLTPESESELESEPVAALPEPAVEAEPTPTFMRQGQRNSRWNRPWVRRSLVAVSVLLVAGFLLQIALHERDRLAATMPESRAALVVLCEVADCQIAPFKHIDAVVIDTSSFVKVRGDVYRLNLTLKNTGPVDVAAPAVELTLTDTQDQPMIRHVLSPTELGAQRGTLTAGGELTAALPLSIKTSGSTERISGYRLLAFYP